MPKCADISKIMIIGSSMLIISQWLSIAARAAATPISIELKNNTDRERQTKAQLERLLSTYDLGKYTFTQNVIIDEKSIPHSHPILTLHTRHLHSDDQLLSTYVHEQLHWYLEGR